MCIRYNLNRVCLLWLMTEGLNLTRVSSTVQNIYHEIENYVFLKKQSWISVVLVTMSLKLTALMFNTNSYIEVPCRGDIVLTVFVC